MISANTIPMIARSSHGLLAGSDTFATGALRAVTTGAAAISADLDAVVRRVSSGSVGDRASAEIACADAVDGSDSIDSNVVRAAVGAAESSGNSPFDADTIEVSADRDEDKVCSVSVLGS